MWKYRIVEASIGDSTVFLIQYRYKFIPFFWQNHHRPWPFNDEVQTYKTLEDATRTVEAFKRADQRRNPKVNHIHEI